MKKQMRIGYYIKNLLIIIFLLSLLFGGDSLFAKEKNVYELTIQKVDGGRITTYLAIASSEYEAKENVTLNGWKILDIKLFTKGTGDTSEIDLAYQAYNKKFDSKSKNNVAQNKDLLKNDDKYKKEYKLVTYFDFAADTTKIDKKTLLKLKKLNKNAVYLIYGHTDSVPVVKNNKNYRNNYELSIKRANFIKNKMIEIANIPEKNIRIIGLGQMFPQASNGFKGNPKNRRVEIYEFVNGS